MSGPRSEKNKKLFLNNRVRELRIKYGWSQSKLAEESVTTQNTISAIENHVYTPTGYLCACLCLAFDVTFEYLFWLDVSE